MSYDADVIVIGGGPAGMTAAFRARWVKTAYVVPSSVLILDPAGPGGIMAIGSIYLTGPAWGYTGEEIYANFARDLEKLNIPVLREAAIALAHDGRYWTVTTPARTLRSLAVVVATGLRCMTGDPDLRRAGRLTFLAGGYARAAETFQRWSREHQGAHVALVGGEALAQDVRRFVEADGGANRITPILEPRHAILGCRIEGEQVILDLERDGRPDQLRCDQVMLDYHSLERTPPAPAFLPAAWKTADGYCGVGPAGLPDVPGLFAAGDCTGAPSMCLKAMAQGAEAGFNAYSYVYARKFGAPPHMFAFTVSPERPPLDEPELPTLDPDRHLPVGLTAESRYPDLLAVTVPDTRPPFTEDDRPYLKREIERKIATVHLREA